MNATLLQDVSQACAKGRLPRDQTTIVCEELVELLTGRSDLEVRIEVVPRSSPAVLRLPGWLLLTYSGNRDTITTTFIRPRQPDRPEEQ